MIKVLLHVIIMLLDIFESYTFLKLSLKGEKCNAFSIFFTHFIYKPFSSELLYFVPNKKEIK